MGKHKQEYRENYEDPDDMYYEDPDDMYNELSQIYCTKPEGRIHTLTKG